MEETEHWSHADGANRQRSLPLCSHTCSPAPPHPAARILYTPHSFNLAWFSLGLKLQPTQPLPTLPPPAHLEALPGGRQAALPELRHAVRHVEHAVVAHARPPAFAQSLPHRREAGGGGDLGGAGGCYGTFMIN